MDLFKRAFLAGLGALNLSRERAKTIVDELVKTGELREQEGRELLQDMMKKAGEVRKEVETTLGQQIAEGYKRLNLASAEQLKKMERRIQDLEKQLRKAGTGVSSGKTGKASAAKPPRRSTGR